MTYIRTSLSRGIGCEIISALIKSPRTIPEVLDMVDCCEQAARMWLSDLHIAGLVRVAGYVARPGEVGKQASGRRLVVYAWQPQPYALPDTATILADSAVAA